jgi:hypothetical protein
LGFAAGTLEELACLFAGIDGILASGLESSAAVAALLVMVIEREY